jgi:flagellar biosynthesis protein FlhF
MNVKRFTARTSRDALVLVRQALGEDAVVLSTKPCVDGVEVLAMAPEGMKQIERMSAQQHAAAPAPGKGLAARSAARVDPALTAGEVEDDVARLSMSTLSFQDYVRERMLRRRQAAMSPDTGAAAKTERPAANPAVERSSVLEQRMSETGPAASSLREPPVLRETVKAAAEIAVPSLVDAQLATHAAASIANAKRDQEDMMSELRSMKGLIEERFGALAFMEKLNRQPAQARLTQKLLDCGFSPALIRKIGDSLPADVVDEANWAAGVLEHNLLTAEADAPIEDQGGVYALVGATGVGKTTTTAKIAAAFATKYGAGNLGLITLDAYRIGAHEQLRAYGRILGVPVHTAHDRASLEDLLELLSAKKMVLIDTAGMAQRDARTRELLEMLSHRSIKKLLVVNAASQGETIEDVMISYHASVCAGIVLSKMDEAVKLGPALDALIRMKLKVVGVANGQRVPEDWHRLSANALVHRALRSGGSSAYRLDASDVSLIFTAPMAGPRVPPRAARNALHA